MPVFRKPRLLYDVLTSDATYSKIQSGIDALSKTVNGYFNRMTVIEDSTGTSISERVGSTIGAAINLAFYTVNSTVTSINWSTIGLSIAQTINGAVEETDFSQIGETIANVFLALPKTLYSTIINTDWSAVGKGISDMVLSALNTVDDFLQNVKWDEIGHSVADFLLGIDWIGIAGEIILVFADALGGLGEAVATAIGDMGPSALEAVGTFTGKIAKTFQALWETISSVNIIDLITGEQDLSDLTADFSVKLHAIWDSDSEEKADKYNSLADKKTSAKILADASSTTNYTKFNNDYQTLVKNPKIGVTANADATRTSEFKTTTSDYNDLSSKTVTATTAGQTGNTFTTTNKTYSSLSSKTATVTLAGNASAKSYVNAKKDYSNVKNKTVTATLHGSSKILKPTLGWQYSGLSAIKKAVGKALFGEAKWPKLYFAARGGIVSAATLLSGNLVAGEAGAEAIIPLERHTEWLDKVAERLSARTEQRNAGQPIQIIVNVGNERMVEQVIDGINAVTSRTGAFALNF